MTHLRARARFALEYRMAALRQSRWADDEFFVRTAYDFLLKRKPDREGLDHYLDLLKRGAMTRNQVLNALLGSEEYRLVYGQEVQPLDALHTARMKLVRECLPPARTIVDLGGASSADQPEGALLVMGYPHRPCEVFVIDLPPAERLAGTRGAESAPAYATRDGATVHYVYQSMAQPLPFEDESVDMVFAGQSIEHVSEAEADLICRECLRILKPGGHFCLDTPNGALTRIQSPDENIHPEHRKEYRVPELRARLEGAGFEIVAGIGICPMPETLATGQFNFDELVAKRGLSDRPEEGYLFFFDAIKRAG